MFKGEIKLKNKVLKIVVLIGIIIFLLLGGKTYSLASSKLSFKEYSKEYQDWLNLSDEERKNTTMPNKMFDIETNIQNSNDIYKINNVFKIARVLKASFAANYDLRTVIPENMKVKDQGNADLCWAFAALANLETNLAMQDKKNGVTAKEYDFSEKHLGYATSREAFLNGVINEKGLDKNANDGGNYYVSTFYLSNGYGAVNESSMPYDDSNFSKIDKTNMDKINTVTTLIDAKFFDEPKTEEEREEITRQIKQHIMNKGAVCAQIFGADITNTSCYNNETGALYVDNANLYPTNHGVVIVGWDDYFSKNNFKEGKRPNNNGAWIIKNSWGEYMETGVVISQNIESLKQRYRNNPAGFTSTYPEITSENQINEEWVLGVYRNQYGETYGRNKIVIKNDKLVIEIGDNGFMYVSYEDKNILSNVYSVENALNYIDYGYIYQNEYLGVNNLLGGNLETVNNKIYLASVFNKVSGEDEISKISINTIIPMNNCKVFINPNSSDKSLLKLQEVNLQEGEYENIGEGYHTIEFANPVKITGSTFVVVVEMDTKNDGQKTYFPVESEMSTLWTNIDVEAGKSFYGEITSENSDIDWTDLSTITGNEAILPIKAFTKKDVSTVVELSSIEVRKAPNKTVYEEGQNFDKTGMKVYAKYTNMSEAEVTNSVIVTNGNNLVKGQQSVTISYTENNVTKTATVNITVNEKVKTLERIYVKVKPTKTVYEVGDNFDKSGMKVYAVYSDETEEQINDFTVVDGTNLSKDKTSVTIKYTKDGVTKQTLVAITVNEKQTEEPNTNQKVLTRIYVKVNPTKTVYEVGDNFDKSGMKVYAVYSDETEEQINDFTVVDGTNLSKDKTSVTIKYTKNGVTKQTLVAITVNEKVKTLERIYVKVNPTKTVYEVGDNFDKTGMKVYAVYSDETEEQINDFTIVDGTNLSKSKTSVTIKYTKDGVTKQTLLAITVNEKQTEENLPTPSDFTKTKSDITKAESHMFTNENKEEYVLMNIKISGIRVGTDGSKREYYYYLSDKKGISQSSIKNWIKFTLNSDGTATLNVDSRNINNFKEISEKENLYIYIKEVSTLNNKSTNVVNMISIDNNTKLQTYLDDKKVEEKANETKEEEKENKTVTDDTTAKNKIPQAGAKVGGIALFIGIIIIGGISYYRYRNIDR